ncbi:MAG: DNA gyrase inhibitor YacG [Nitrosomonas sp.]|nr:MAG: DNA gyrase inhibitor YacG [Nitrosomonas sp.]
MHKHLVSCPQCGKKVVWEVSSQFKPFCSERCKAHDLAQWAKETYRISEPDNNQQDKEPAGF